MTRRIPRRGPLRQLLRQADGTLYDVTEERPIARSELLDSLRAGGFFKARREDNGADCTAQVLCEVLSEEARQWLVPGVAGGAPWDVGGPLELLGRILGAGKDLKRAAERP